MALHADGGVVATKPYPPSGKYIPRKSNDCEGCRFDPIQRHGANACPLTTCYRDFLIRHEERSRKNNRMALILNNANRMANDEKRRIRKRSGGYG